MSFFIREMQIKTVMTYHHTSSRIAEIKGLILSSVGEGMEQLELSYPLMGVHLGSATLENSLVIATKAECIDCDPRISFLGHNACIYTEVYTYFFFNKGPTRTFTAALFIIA